VRLKSPAVKIYALVLGISTVFVNESVDTVDSVELMLRLELLGITGNSGSGNSGSGDAGGGVSE
jgi:hypothetical protein